MEISFPDGLHLFRRYSVRNDNVCRYPYRLDIRTSTIPEFDMLSRPRPTYFRFAADLAVGAGNAHKLIADPTAADSFVIILAETHHFAGIGHGFDGQTEALHFLNEDPE